MKIMSKLIAGLLVAGATMAFAETESTDPTVIARQDVMKHIGGGMKVLGGMAGDKMAFDQKAAEEAKTAILSNSALVAEKFKTNVTDAGSEAKPAIWENWDDFSTKAAALTKAAEGLKVDNLDDLKATIGAVGGACKACHTDYRM